MLLFVFTVAVLLSQSYALSYSVCDSPPEPITSDILIDSPNYPHNYHNGRTCEIHIAIGIGYEVSFGYEVFRTEDTHDVATITMNDQSYVSSGSATSLPEGWHHVREFTCGFRSDSSNSYSGFRLRVSVRHATNFWTNIDSYNGILNHTTTTSVGYNFSEASKWNMSVELRASYQVCPSGSQISIYLSKIRIWNFCESPHIFHGKMDMIIIDGNPSIEALYFTSFRSRGKVSCYPDFDCGNKICVPMITKCDGMYDCENDADEKDCNASTLHPHVIERVVERIVEVNCTSRNADASSTTVSTSTRVDTITPSSTLASTSTSTTEPSTISTSTTTQPPTTTTTSPTTMMSSTTTTKPSTSTVKATPASQTRELVPHPVPDPEHSKHIHRIYLMNMSLFLLIAVIAITYFVRKYRKRYANHYFVPSVEFLNEKI